MKLTNTEKEIFKAIAEYQVLNADEKRELLDIIDENTLNLDGFDYLEFNELEIRVIPKDCIEQVYEDTIKDIVEDCYSLNLDSIPDFVAFEIDWAQTAENCMVDGYGHTFSGYDGSEYESTNFYYFRTN